MDIECVLNENETGVCGSGLWIPREVCNPLYRLISVSMFLIVMTAILTWHALLCNYWPGRRLFGCTLLEEGSQSAENHIKF